MCVIVTAPAGFLPSDDELEAMSRANPDGFGYALRTPDDVLKSSKSDCAGPLLDYIACHRDMFTKCDVLLHFRLATHGDVCVDNCQPIQLSDSEFFVHNGIAWQYVDGLYECDSFNLAAAWRDSRDTRIFDGNAVGAATLDNEGLHWLYGGMPLPSVPAVRVSNLHWTNYM